jgi:hypothetical protein
MMKMADFVCKKCGKPLKKGDECLKCQNEDIDKTKKNTIIGTVALGLLGIVASVVKKIITRK